MGGYLKDIKDLVWENVDWTHLPKDRDQWRDLVNVVLKFSFNNDKEFLD
jgi:hypothetical protein